MGVLQGDFSGGILGFEARASASLKIDDIFEYKYCILCGSRLERRRKGGRINRKSTD